LRNYFTTDFFSDLKAGFVTAVVALPLAIAFALASGVGAKMGLVTAVLAGVVGSLAGGSRFSITGPTGAMTVIILATVNRYGIEGLMLCGLLAGVIQGVFGLLRFGSVVKFIPLPVISGFTSGIGAIILIGQLPNLFGIDLKAKEHVWETAFELSHVIGNANSAAILIAAMTILILLIAPKYLTRSKFTKSIPASIIALVLAVTLTSLFALPIPIVGEIPQGLPAFTAIKFQWPLVKEILPSAFTIAMLGAIEALLCAVVCDGMTGQKHDSNRELLGQGLANMLLPWFGGIAATAAIARSAVNIREGARTRMAGVYHALILMVVVLFLAPVAEKIPKSFLAGILIVVAMRMINLKEFRLIKSISNSDTIVFLLTFSLTVLTDLVFAVQVGMTMAIFLLFIRLIDLVDVRSLESEEEDGYFAKLIRDDSQLREKLNVYTIYGPFFFGAMNVFDRKLKEHMNMLRPITVLRMKFVPFIDSTGIQRLKEFVTEHERSKSVVVFSGLTDNVEAKLKSDPELHKLFEQSRVYEHTHQILADLDRLLRLRENSQVSNSGYVS